MGEDRASVSTSIRLESGTNEHGHFDVEVGYSRFARSYTIIKSMGTGGFGEVFSVKCLADQQKYAIKKIKLGPEAKGEARLQAAFNHQHLVRYFGSWSEEGREDEYNKKVSRSTPVADLNEEDPEPKRIKLIPNGTFYLKMKLYKCSLLAVLHPEREGALSLVELGFFSLAKMWTVVGQMSDALAYLHRRNITHADVKPDNILMARKTPFQVVLSDFGISELRNKEGLAMRRTTATNRPFGTAPYHANEASRGLTPPCDVYSLGVVLFEMATKLVTGEPFQNVDDCCQLLFSTLVWRDANSPLPNRPASWAVVDEASVVVDEASRAVIYNLFLQMVKFQPDSRPTCEQIYNKLLTDGLYQGDGIEDVKLRLEVTNLKAAVETKMDDLNTKMDDLKKDVNQRLATVETKVGDLNTKMDDLKKDVEAKLDQLLEKKNDPPQMK